MTLLSRIPRMAGLPDWRTTAPLGLLCGLSVIDWVDQSAFSVLSPNIRDAFGLSNAGITVFAALLVPVVLVIGVPMGYVSDRVNRVRIATIGAFTWGVFCILTGAAPVLWVLFVARLGAGIGGAVNAPTHQSLLADYYEPRVRSRVYGVYQIAGNVGQFLGPLLAGLLAAVAGWRLPFLLLAPLTFVVAAFAWRLQEPRRGAHERAAEGIDESLLGVEEEAPGWEESWRIVKSVRTLRQVYRAAPFLFGGILSVALLRDLFMSDVFHLGSAARGTIDASTQPFAVLGLAVGAVVAGRLLDTRPARIFGFITICATVVAVGFVGFALSPNVPVMLVWSYLVAVAGSAILPGLVSVVSLVAPPRARSFSFSAFQIYALPGMLALPVAGIVSDHFGMRWGLTVMVPVFLLGGYLLGYAGVHVGGDVEQVRRLARSRAELRAARDAGGAPLLVVRDVQVHYGQVQVLFGVDLQVEDGEIVALVGTNGAGKSTLLKGIAGIVQPSGGTVLFDGRDISAMTPQEILRSGIAYMPGGKGVFQTLTVADNLEAAAWTLARHAAEVSTRVEDVFAQFPKLQRHRDNVAGNLSGGEQQMLALGMALLTRPRLLMIDELSLGLAPAVVDELLEMVKQLHAAGTTIIIVEQSINVALTVAKRAVFLEKGEVRFEGPTSDLLDRPDVLRSVFLAAPSAGDNAAQETERRVQENPGDPILAVQGLAKSFGGVHAVHDVDLLVQPDEILGIIGPNGAGKTTLFDLLTGFQQPDAGTIVLQGTPLGGLGPDRRARLGLGRSFQDARLVPSMTVRETIALAHERHLQFVGLVPVLFALPEQRVEESILKRRVGEVIDVLGLGQYADKFIGELSTGTRRIVEFGCVIAHRPQLLLLDEPSSGIAQRESEALGPLLLRLKASIGATLVVIEHDIPLVSSLADRLVAMDLGTVIATGAPAEVLAHPHVVASYLGSNDAVIARSGALSGRGR
jgi:ABC-type branched-subunit amino acid transport system ATPase component/predicted MFS family arabinose efflux permease